MSTSRKDAIETEAMLNRLQAAGISRPDAESLRRISMILHRWQELECGNGDDKSSWAIERGRRTPQGFEYDEDGAPYMIHHWHDGRTTNYRLADRERGALRRLGNIMAKYPALRAYIQGDVR